jgi:SAM-dependent methyltransferase
MRLGSYEEIPGWFDWVDCAMFNTVMSAQRAQPAGTLVELGAYLGRSAVVIGDHLRPGERFVVVDLFGDNDRLGPDPSGTANRAENARDYANLTRPQFEANYLGLHTELPVVVQDLSSAVVHHVDRAGVRFMHVDASHMYDAVRVDVQNARDLLRPGGVVVFDDYRSPHTPGVAAAVWEAVTTGGLIPFALTSMKLYAVYQAPEPYLDAVHALVANEPNLWADVQVVRGSTVVRVCPRG